MRLGEKSQRAVQPEVGNTPFLAESLPARHSLETESMGATTGTQSINLKTHGLYANDSPSAVPA
jgi:hypothetical protein